MPQGKKKQERDLLDPSTISRLTFRLDEDTVATFKTIAAIKRVKLEDLGREAIKDIIKKYKSTIQNYQVMI